MKTPLDAKKILIIKLRYIGDTLSLLPVVDTFSRGARNATLDVMVNRGTEEILSSHPGIRRLWVYDRAAAKRNILSSLVYHIALIGRIRSERFDAVIDFTHGDRAAFIAFMTGAPYRVTYQNASTLSRLLLNRTIRSDPFEHHIVDQQLKALSLFGIEHLDRTLRLPLPQAAVERADSLMAAAKIPEGMLKVAIHPGARGRLRQWPAERFGEIARRIKENYPSAIILIGGPGETELLETVEKQMGFPASLRSNRLNLLEMGALLSRCRLFVGNDSAPGHIAAAVGCPSLTLFGPTFPHMWRPLSEAGEVVFKNVPCCGCPQETCLNPDANCMELIGVEEVWGKVKRLLVAP